MSLVAISAIAIRAGTADGRFYWSRDFGSGDSRAFCESESDGRTVARVTQSNRISISIY